jgi:hypothetical protein
MDKAFIEEYRGNYRVLVVFAPEEMDEAYRLQHRYLTTHEGGIMERDLKVVHSFARVEDVLNEEGARLREAYHLPPVGFYMLLIGKDGTVKERYSQPTEMEQIFALIDSMPMRQQEMREDS